MVRLQISLVILGLIGTLAGAEEAEVPALARPQIDPEPVLRLEGGGATSPIISLAFGPGGNCLYEAGWDKVVRVWRRDPRTGLYVLDADSTLRIPIGPGDAGGLLALAVSEDGAWLAAAGNAVIPGQAGFRELGLILPREGLSDPFAQGTIYAFDLRANPSRCRQIHAHPGAVRSLVFASTPGRNSTLLVSAAHEFIGGASSAPYLVLRARDVLRGQEMSKVVVGEASDFRPWLVAWTVPPGHAQVCVATAFGSSGESLFVWNLGSDQAIRIPDRRRGWCNTIVRSLTSGQLFSGHFTDEPVVVGGYLEARRDTALQDPPRIAKLSWGMGRDETVIKPMPIAQALVRSRPGGPIDLLAIVVRLVTKQDSPETEYQLQLLAIDPERFGEVRARALLWSGPIVQPWLTADPDGSLLAVAGNPEKEILVYSIADVLANRSATQRLRGLGASIHSASFVRRAPGEMGIRFQQAGTTGSNEMVLDLGNRRLLRDRGQWQPDSPKLEGWQIQLQPALITPIPRPLRLWTYKNRKPLDRPIVIYPDNESAELSKVAMTSSALLPPGRIGVPIVAIALHEEGVGPSLWLADANTGERFRKLTGHTGSISSLAFSADGRFLVSASEDQTICLWSLTDLDQILAKRGGLPGLVLTSGRDGRYTVLKLLRSSPYRGHADIMPRDVVEGYLDGQGVLHPLTSALDLHYRAAELMPGKPLRLRRLRAGADEADVELTLAQAVDERKPLATLFITRERPGFPPEWLAWNPFGPFDSSGPGAEFLFGWHFNAPDRPEFPVRYAPARDYRARYRREGLLGELIKDGRLSPAPAPAMLQSSDFELFIDADGQPVGDQLLVQQRPASLNLALKPDISADRIEAVTWRVNSSPPREMEPDGCFWSASLTDVRWDRTPHTLSVEVRSRGQDEPMLTKSLKVLYLPPPPRLIARAPEGLAAAATTGLEVREQQFRIAFEIEPAPDAIAQARLTARSGDVLLVDRTYRQPRVEEIIELRPGDNAIELEVVNEGARSEFRAQETRRFGPLRVRYSPRPARPPRIELTALDLLTPADGGRLGSLRVVGSSPCEVKTTPRVMIRGRVIPGEGGKLGRLEWRRGAIWERLEGSFAADLPGTFEIGQGLALEEGRQTIGFRAQTLDDDRPEAVGEAWLVVDYHPQVPGLKELVIEPGGPIIRYGNDPRPEPAKLSVRIAGLAANIAEATILLNEAAIPDRLKIDPKTATVSGSLDLRPGMNRVQVRLSNRWSTTLSDPVEVAYRLLPLVTRCEVKQSKGRPFARVSAQVASSAEIVASVSVERGGKSGEARRWSAITRRETTKGMWVLDAEVGLEEGDNDVVVQVSNRNGPSKEVRQTLRYTEPPKPRPALTVETRGKVETSPETRFSFQVRSPSPLIRVMLMIAGDGAERPKEVEIDLGRVARSPDWGFVLKGEELVPLSPGTNLLTVVARNEGGESRSEPCIVSYTQPAVRLEIVGVEPRVGGREPVPPRGQPGGLPRVPGQLPSGDVRLSGRVISSGEALPMHANGRVQVWVNGFPQVSVNLDEVSGRELERTFVANLLLSQLKDNEIEIRIEGIPAERLGNNRFLADCARLNADWRLHMLIVAIGGDQDWDALRDSAVEALKGQYDFDDSSKTRFHTPAFHVATIHGMDRSREVSRFWMINHLHKICRKIQLNKQPRNDVVIVCYKGGEVILSNSPSLVLRPKQTLGQNDVMPLSEIAELFKDTNGAKLFLLDVTHPKDQKAMILAQSLQLRDEKQPIGVLRFSWDVRPVLRKLEDDVTLVASLRQALRSAVTLEQVSQALRMRSSLLSQTFPGLEYQDGFNIHFNNLRLGGP